MPNGQGRGVNKKLKKFLLGLGIVSSILGVVSSSVALYLHYLNEKES